MYKVGDTVIFLNHLIEGYKTIVEITESKYICYCSDIKENYGYRKETFHNETFQPVLKEVYESPLFQALKEE